MKATKAYTVPSSSVDITLGQFQEVMALEDDEVLKAISILTDIDQDTLNAMKANDVARINDLCMKALFDKDQPTRTRWTHTARVAVKRKYGKWWQFWKIKYFREYKTTTYGLHPQFASMSWGEMTNLEPYMNKEETFHKGMAVAYREVTIESEDMDGLYDIVPYTGTEKTADIFKEIPLSYFYGLRSFFLRTGRECELISHRYSTQAGTVKT